MTKFQRRDLPPPRRLQSHPQLAQGLDNDKRPLSVADAGPMERQLFVLGEDGDSGSKRWCVWRVVCRKLQDGGWTGSVSTSRAITDLTLEDATSLTEALNRIAERNGVHMGEDGVRLVENINKTRAIAGGWSGWESEPEDNEEDEEMEP